MLCSFLCDQIALGNIESVLCCVAHETQSWSSVVLEVSAKGAVLFLEDDFIQQLLKKLYRGPDSYRECEYG